MRVTFNRHNSVGVALNLWKKFTLSTTTPVRGNSSGDKILYSIDFSQQLSFIISLYFVLCIENITVSFTVNLWKDDDNLALLQLAFYLFSSFDKCI